MGQAESTSEYHLFAGFGLTINDALKNLHYQVIGRNDKLSYTIVECSCKEKGCPMHGECADFICDQEIRYQVDYSKSVTTGVWRALIAVPRNQK